MEPGGDEKTFGGREVARRVQVECQDGEEWSERPLTGWVSQDILARDVAELSREKLLYLIETLRERLGRSGGERREQEQAEVRDISTINSHGL